MTENERLKILTLQINYNYGRSPKNDLWWSFVEVRSDWFVYAVLYALPWVGAELTEKKANDLKEMLDAIKRFLDQRQKLHVQILRVWSGDKPHVQEEYLDCLWAQVEDLNFFGFVKHFLLRCILNIWNNLLLRDFNYPTNEFSSY